MNTQADPFIYSLPLSLSLSLSPLKKSLLCFLSPSYSFSFDILLLVREEPLEEVRRGRHRSWKLLVERKAMGGCKEEMRMEGYSVVCPKPRRLDMGLFDPSFHDHNFRPSFRWPINHQMETGDSEAGTELLDIILTKGNYAEKSCNQEASSPPFFCGSPPSRASNPVIQDEQFGNENVTPFSPVAPPSPSARKGRGCVRVKFGHKPATVRVEGFDCLSTDRRNCSISAVA